MGSEDYDMDYDDTSDDVAEDNDAPEEIVQFCKPDWMEERCWDIINEIEDLEVRQDQMKLEEKLHEKRVELNRKYETGEIDDFGYWVGDHDLHFEAARVGTRRALRSVGLDWDQLAEIAEDYDLLLKGGPDLVDLSHQVNDVVKEDPVGAQELADEMYEEGRLGEEAYQLICEKVKRYR